jgi:hypothetical protein
MDVGRVAEAEPHFRWCFSRRPQNKELGLALAQISKRRHAPRSPRNASHPDLARSANP